MLFPSPSVVKGVSNKMAEISNSCCNTLVLNECLDTCVASSVKRFLKQPIVLILRTVSFDRTEHELTAGCFESSNDNNVTTLDLC